MGHKPDQKARKKRREREAKKQPPLTARGLFDSKRQATQEREAKLQQLMDAASGAVKKEFRRCEGEIDAMHRAHGSTQEQAWCTTTLYRSLNGPLNRLEIAALKDLLCVQGWDVRLVTPATGKRGPKPVELVLYHHHRSHGPEDAPA
ncbi:MAG TPA: hypothetical protein VL283_01725 [Candidatus Baltobacteraceae bacterium]|nr:hypothetical protein [Candidatus Baltobacteraceae bacterium]